MAAYNSGELGAWEMAMPKRAPVKSAGEAFGERLARLRGAAGFTQRELAREIGISQRMVAYYEGETEYPPAHLLPALGRALGVTADELLGMGPPERHRVPRDDRLWRRFQEIARLPAMERRRVVQFLDVFLDRQRLARAAG